MRPAIITAAVLMLGACTSHGEEREAARATGQRSFQVGQFDGVSLQGSHDVVVTVGGAPSVRAEGDSDTLERLEIRVEEGMLKISTRPDRSWWRFRRRHVTVYVSVPALNRASLAGSGDLRIDRVQAQDFEARLGGSGDIRIGALQARRASFALAGSGDIQAAGAAEEVDVSLAGSGDVGLGRLQARSASVSLAGSGDISVRASEAVEGRLMGSGDIRVFGAARCSITKRGSGDIHCGV